MILVSQAEMDKAVKAYNDQLLEGEDPITAKELASIEDVCVVNHPVCHEHNSIMMPGTYTRDEEYKDIHKTYNGRSYYCMACAMQIGLDAEYKNLKYFD